MDAGAVALQVTTVVLLSSPLCSPPAVAVEPEKQPVYANIDANGLCGSEINPCEVPAGQRLIIDHVSGYTLLPASTNTTSAIQLVVNDPKLGIHGSGFHSFVATKTYASGSLDTFTFSTPLRMMLYPGASFYFHPGGAYAVSGYLVKQL